MNEEITQQQLGIVGQSPKIRELVGKLRQVADTDITVLLIGESGVGKEVFARAIHTLSKRSGGKLIAVNCGAIPETLLESELFGHEKGAFTGAVESRKGLFEAASGGTLFLDEIGEMSLATQVKLLRVLETFEFTRVGTTEPRHTDVRLVAATNRNLERDVQNGNFRQDLFYRLHSACLTIPPLRERTEDIPLFVQHFAQTIAKRLGADFPGVTPEALDVLTSYPWPGNVRELKNFIELVITLERGEVITEEIVYRHLDISLRPNPADNPNAIIHLAGRTPEQAERELIYRALIDLRNEVGSLKQIVQHLGVGSQQEPARAALPAATVQPQSSVDLLTRQEMFNLDEVERALIIAALRKYHGNRRQAANALGVSERTLYRKLREKMLEGEVEMNGFEESEG